MNQILEQLHADHKNFATLLHLLERETEHLSAGEFTDMPLLTDILHYFMMHPDSRHHPLEDAILDILKDKNKDTADQIDEILSDHEVIAEQSRLLYDEVRQIQGNAIFPREKLVSQLEDYIHRYWRHMDMEENELLTLADDSFDAGDWERISADGCVGSDPLFGEVLSDEYRTLFSAIMAESDDS